MSRNVQICHIFFIDSDHTCKFNDTIRQLSFLKETGLINKAVLFHQNETPATHPILNSIDHAFIKYHPTSNLMNVLNLIKHVAQGPISHLHVHDWRVMKSSARASRLLGKALICSVAGLPDKKSHLNFIKPAKKLICADDFIKQELLKSQIIDQDKLHSIYFQNGQTSIESATELTSREQALKTLSIDPQTFIIANNGALTPEEDQTTLLKAFHKLHKKKMKAVLLLNERGSMRSVLEKLIEKFELNGSVLFLNENQMEQLLPVVDVLVVTSFQEHLHPSIIPALRHGVVVVATKMPGNRGVIRDMKTGFLVPCGFPERIESVLSRMYVNPQLKSDVAKSAKEFAQTHFSSGHASQQLQEIYGIKTLNV